jgi:hypothetical protein
VSITAAGRASQRVGFGDDVAASAGLLAWDDSGRPVFCGDAIADPLTGITAAALAMSDGPGTLWDVSMTDVVAATLTDTESEPTLPLEPPTAREPRGTASAMGADTADVLKHFGII